MRLHRREQRRQGLDAQHAIRQRCCIARRVTRLGDDGEAGLADVVDGAVGQDRVVVDDRPTIVRAGDVARNEDRDHAWHPPDAVEVDAEQLAVGDMREPERRMQRAGELGQVVDVGRAARDVQVPRLVRPRDADPCAGLDRHRICVGLRLQPGRVDGAVHGVTRAEASPGVTCGIALQTLVSCSPRGPSRRVSSQSRRRRFFATWRR